MVEHMDEDMPLGNTDVCRIIGAIKSSEVLEDRIQLIGKLGELHLNDSSENLSVVEFLSEIWEDFTCLDISQCRLNLTILIMSEKFASSNVSECLIPFTMLLIKSTEWSKKHLKMSLMSSGESEEDNHSDHFFQLIISFLTMSAPVMIAVTRSPFLNDSKVIGLIEKFMTHLLSFVKDVVSVIKMINSLGSEILKSICTVIDSVIKLWKDYSMDANWDDCDARVSKREGQGKTGELDKSDHLIIITNCALKHLSELGVLAAKDGGRLVNVLNVSWKGVVTILQQVKGKIRGTFNVQEIMISLISLVKEHTSCAAESWSDSPEEIVSASEARRMLLPIKFYLVHLIKICSLYANEAFNIHREIILLYIELCTFKALVSSDKLLHTTSEVFSDLLEVLTSEMVCCLLNSEELTPEQKFEILDSIFPEEYSTEMMSDLRYTNHNHMAIMIGILSGSYEDLQGVRVLSFGRVVAFYFLIRNSPSFDEAVKSKVAVKLEWFFNAITDQEVYSFVLDIKILVPCGSDKKSELVWQPMFSALTDSLKAFMIVASSSSAWVVLKDIIAENIFHPYFLCWEIVIQLWRFLITHAEPNLVKEIFRKFCSIMNLIAYPELVSFAGSPFRKMARTICLLLGDSNTSIVDYVYMLVVGNEENHIMSLVFLALLIEGFPINSLSENVRGNVKKKLISDYIEYIDNFEKTIFFNDAHDTIGLPVFALSAALNFHQVTVSETEMKTIKLLLALIKVLRNNTAQQFFDRNLNLLTHVLSIFSHLKHLYLSDHMEEVLFELKQLFMSDTLILHQCKPSLSKFMGELGYMDMGEDSNCEKFSAVCDLFHLILREKHWALAHLAIASFGSFAARTSCNQLWRFVPDNAALAYDLAQGKEFNEDIFMSELKAFLEKEMALSNIDSCCEQRELLFNESLMLQEYLKILIVHVGNFPSDIESKPTKKRKLPEGITKGLELLQSGIKDIENGLSQLQTDNFGSSDSHEKFLTQCSRLGDMIGQLMKLSESR